MNRYHILDHHGIQMSFFFIFFICGEKTHIHDRSSAHIYILIPGHIFNLNVLPAYRHISRRKRLYESPRAVTRLTVYRPLRVICIYRRCPGFGQGKLSRPRAIRSGFQSDAQDPAFLSQRAPSNWWVFPDISAKEIGFSDI